MFVLSCNLHCRLHCKWVRNATEFGLQATELLTMSPPSGVPDPDVLSLVNWLNCRKSRSPAKLIGCYIGRGWRTWKACCSSASCCWNWRPLSDVAATIVAYINPGTWIRGYTATWTALAPIEGWPKSREALVKSDCPYHPGPCRQNELGLVSFGYPYCVSHQFLQLQGEC